MGEVLRILIADDDMDICRIWRNEIEKFFDKSGQKVEVFEAYDGDSAWNMFIEVKPDLVILDVMMPGLDGFSVFNELRKIEETKNIPIIMLTGVADKTGIKFFQKDMKNFFGDTPIEYLEKPLNPEKLKSVVMNIFNN